MRASVRARAEGRSQRRSEEVKGCSFGGWLLGRWQRRQEMVEVGDQEQHGAESVQVDQSLASPSQASNSSAGRRMGKRGEGQRRQDGTALDGLFRFLMYHLCSCSLPRPPREKETAAD